MSKLSGWSMFWIALTAIEIIAAIGRVILIHQEKQKKKNQTDIGKAVGGDTDNFTNMIRDFNY